jgi:hypothetical protein
MLQPMRSVEEDHQYRHYFPVVTDALQDCSPNVLQSAMDASSYPHSVGSWWHSGTCHTGGLSCTIRGLSVEKAMFEAECFWSVGAAFAAIAA